MDEEEIIQTAKKVAIGSVILAGTAKVAQATVKGLKGIDRNIRERQAKKYGPVKKKKPLPDRSYGVIMRKEDKAKLGIGSAW